MRIYLASAYGRANEMRTIADILRTEGHVITARWIEGNHDTPPEGIAVDSREHLAWAATDDLDDVADAECVVSFTGNGVRSKGGRHVEFGVGIALGKRMVIVGERENVFHNLPSVEQYDGLAAAMAALRD